jgi:lipopolysaccharide/colanic/teichoic acid biosynthesis glycosyltransferase
MSILTTALPTPPDGDDGLLPAGTASPGSDRAWRSPRKRYAAVKGVLERLAALFLLVPAAPLIGLAGLLIKLTSRGPVFYSQTRLGRGGRPYTMHKLRTMTHDCEKHSGPRWSTEGDPRITPVGRFLRRTHLDELPQLWNVLRGDMGLVGPRPERPEFVVALEKALSRYRERMLVKPGVTGLAQVQLPPDTDLTSVRRKLAYDLYYVYHMSAWLDARIFLGTALKVVGVPFAVLGKVALMPSRQTVEQTYRRTSPDRLPERTPAQIA